MRVYLKVLTIFCVFVFYGSAWAGGEPQDFYKRPAAEPSQFDSLEKADTVYSASGWKLNIYITQKGTRSQGSHGLLFYNGQEVTGQLKETKNIPIGTVQYEGQLHEKANLWDDSGWQITNPLVEPTIQYDEFEQQRNESTLNVLPDISK